VTELIVEDLLPPDVLRTILEADVRCGLTASPKWLPPRWLYDERGSELFEQITQLPEYYPTRAERSILRAHATDIATASGADTLVELGAGSAEKTRLLLDALLAAGTLRRYVPVDVSADFLRSSAQAIADAYPVTVHAVAADFLLHLDRLPTGGRRLVAFLGGTIGNLLPDERAAFLRAVRASLEPGDTLLLGTDLVKGADVLVPAYDDAAGVTAAFDLNVLAVLNRELGADFDPARFRHRAVWDAEHEWIEMRLGAVGAQVVRVADLDLEVRFADGEEIRTEISAKFRLAGVEAELAAAGFRRVRCWTDDADRFGLSLARAV
jgi:L-histidine N-alpha-methyltransferase